MRCPKCQADLFQDKDGEMKERGLHNTKNLFRKPNKQEWLILGIILLVIILALLYLRDINALKQYIADYCVCQDYMSFT